MRVLFLGPKESKVYLYLKKNENYVIQKHEKITIQLLKDESIDFIVCYGYRHIIKKDIIAAYKNRIINLHISYLPYNRGSDPNLWSFLDNTKKGVTIHYIDEGIDTGDIICQKEVDFDYDNDTLETSYNKLIEEIEFLFIDNWESIKLGICKRKKQPKIGTYHKSKDKEKVEMLLEHGYKLKIKHLYNVNNI